LLGELGYPTSTEDARARLGRVLGYEDAGVFVCEVAGEAVGLAAYQVVHLLERPQPQCRITALVVRAQERRRGVAAALIAAVESVAREASCFRLEVTTQPRRDDAAAFYLANGFHERPRRLVKPIS
jgi:GNAT superfamily N-acetyltransferase